VSRNRIVVAILVAVLVGGGYFAFGRGPKIAPPQIAEEGVEPDVLEAVREARNNVIASPSDAAIWGQYGMVLRAHILHNEANIAFAEAQRRNPYDARWPYLIGEYLQSRDPEAALPYLRQAVAASSPKPEHQSMTRLKLAEALLQRQDYVEAEKWFREQLGVRPNDHTSRARQARPGAAVRQSGCKRRGISQASHDPVGELSTTPWRHRCRHRT
jgi:tetratricopeptide (TPR) repeat protein